MCVKFVKYTLLFIYTRTDGRRRRRRRLLIQKAMCTEPVKILHSMSVFLFLYALYGYIYIDHMFIFSFFSTIAITVFYYSFMLWSITWLLFFCVYARTKNNTKHTIRNWVVNSFLVSFGSFTLQYNSEWLYLRLVCRYCNDRGWSLSVYVRIKYCQL